MSLLLTWNIFTSFSVFLLFTLTKKMLAGRLYFKTSRLSKYKCIDWLQNLDLFSTVSTNSTENRQF